MSLKETFLFAGAPYSNSAPLVDFLQAVDECVRVTNDHPAHLAAALRAGKVDVALIPVVDLLIASDLVALDGLGVASNGPVKSVLLKCNVPIDQIYTVARDPSSATSNALIEVLFQFHFKRSIKMAEGPDADAWVMIGDRALCSEPSVAGDIDLAEVWRSMTGLPFVFAVWAVRKDFKERDAVYEIVHKAYAEGKPFLSRIAQRYAKEYGRTQTFWFDYLSTSIHYVLDERDRAGMERFRQLLGLDSF